MKRIIPTLLLLIWTLVHANAEVIIKADDASQTIILTATIVPLSDNATTGGITVLASGGTTPYSYLWSGGETTSSITNKNAGEYSVTVTDASGNSVTRVYTIGYKVQWKDLTGVTDNGGVLTKTSSVDWGNGGANASNVLSSNQNGWIAFEAKQTNSRYSMGFTTNKNSYSYTAVLQGIIFVEDGQFYSNESGVYAAMGTWQEGDMFRLSRIGSQVKYYRNGVELKTASVAANTELHVKSALYKGSSPVIYSSFNRAIVLSNSITPVLADGTQGGITVVTSGGTAPYSYQWSSGETTSSITNKNAGEYSVTVTDASGSSVTRVYAIGYKVQWKDLTGATDNGGVLTKTSSVGWGNGGANASNVLSANQNGWIAFEAKHANSRYSIGFSVNMIDYSYTAVLQGMVLSEDGRFYSNESGVYSAMGTWQEGDMFRLSRTGNQVKYYRNGVELKTASVAANTELHVKSALYMGSSPVVYSSFNSKISLSNFITPVLADGTQGDIEVVPSGGLPPYTYLWSSGETTAKIYNKPAGKYTVTVSDSELRTITREYYVGYRAQWQDLLNVTDNEGVLTKTASASWGNGGSNSSNTLSTNQDGWITFEAKRTNSTYSIGFAINTNDYSYTGLLYGIEIVEDGQFYSNESGAYALMGYWQGGDIFKVSRVGNQVKYYQNGVELKSVSVNANTALKIKSAIFKGTSPAVYTSFINADQVQANPNSILSNLAFQYKYDARRRMIAKKVPGADWVYMVYDNRDRLVLTQDGNQRSNGNNYWTFTKYDELNRPIATGIRSSETPLSQEAMQQEVDAYYAAMASQPQRTYGERFIGNSVQGNVHGYTNTSYPITTNGAVLDANRYLTVTYYDNYDFKILISDTQYDYKNNDFVDQYKDENNTSFTRIRGQVAGTKTKVIGTSNYLWSVNYYDDRYRVVQSITTNTKSGTDRSTMVYDFVGKVLKTKTVHNTTASAKTIDRSFVYDHAGRLVKTFHGVNGATPVLLTQNEYNELGQLVDKKLHSADNGGTFKQSVDYRYNIRGWLNTINDIAAPEASDLFSMNLNYNTPTANGGAAQYNGNISEILWKGADNKTNSYAYSYDPMNRLTEGKYYNAADPTQNNRFNEKIWDNANNQPGYDLNGNIKFLSRSGKTGVASGITTYGNMDNLTYTYIGNQLLKVADSNVKTEGFVDGANVDNDYAYDVNGNMTTDKNKSITAVTTANGNSNVTYNYLNLVDKVVKSTGDYVKYTYDATGRKLKQEVYSPTNVLKKKTDYAGEFFYENDTLKFINHEEGRITMTGAQPEYQYNLKDHLGNVRVTFTTKEETETNTATLESANLTAETSKFLRRDRVRIVNNPWFDHTNDATAANGGAIRLNGSANEKTGLIRSMAVMPGDVINAEVYAKYIDTNPANWTAALNTLLTQIANGTTPAGTVIDGASYPTNSSNPFSLMGKNNTAASTGTGPKAYLNYLVYDKDFNFKTGGYQRLSATPKESGNNVAHEKLSAQINITEAGFVYIYLSNEEVSPVEVFFDDFLVAQVKSPVIAEQSYYGFGLSFNEYSRERSIYNRYQYNGKERQKDLGLEWLDYGARMYDPAIGRWSILDPLSEKGRRWSPYSYAFDNPIRFIDPDGMWPDLPGWGDVRDFANGVVNAIVSNNTTIAGVDGTILAQGVERGLGSGSYSNGQTVGDVISVAQGVIESGLGALTTGTGGTITVAGAPTAVVSVVGVGVTAVGVAATAHGVSTAKNGLNNLMKSDHLQGGNRLPSEKIKSAPSERGKAPIGEDGHPVELHHREQTKDGPIDEQTRTDHRGGDNYKKNHSNTGSQKSTIDRKDFNKQRQAHWKKEWDSGRFDDR